MCENPAATIVENFSTLKDHRMRGKIRHKLIDIIILSICAVICGADEFKQIEEYGKVKKEWLKTFLELPNGIPSHDTIGRVFAAIDPEKCRQCLGPQRESAEFI